MQFSELDTEVQRRLEETSAGVWATQTQRKEALNDAYEEISDATEWYETSQTLSLTTSTYYDLSSLLTRVPLSVTAIFNTQSSAWLVPTTEVELDSNYPKWEDATGTPHRYLIRGLWWLGLFPKMASATGTISVSHTAIPVALSADGDTPGFPTEYHLGLVEYALYDLLCQDGETQKAMQYWARFDPNDRNKLVGGYLYYQQELAKYTAARQTHDRISRFGR